MRILKLTQECHLDAIGCLLCDQVLYATYNANRLGGARGLLWNEPVEVMEALYGELTDLH